MDSSKRSRPGAGRIIIRHILFFLLFYLVNSGLTFLLREPDKLYVVTARETAKERKGEIDTLIFGTSHTVYGIDPKPFEDELGWTAFNAGTMLQDMQGAYFYLKDFDKYNDIKRVIVNVSYSAWASNYKNQTKSLIILDRLLSPVVYAEYAWDTLEWNDLYDLLFVPYRYRSNATWEQVKENVTGKLNKSYTYTKKTLDGDRRRFPYMGFTPVGTIRNSAFRKIPNVREWKENDKSAENEEYFSRMLDYCNKNGIEVILMTTPVTDAYLLQIPDYDDIHAYFQGFAQEYGLKYYDYNLIRKEYYRNETGYYWEDGHHMAFYGAQTFSRAFAVLLAAAERGEDVNKWFYNDFQEYVDSYDDIAGVRIRTRDMEDGTYRIRVEHLTGTYVEAEYQVLARLIGEKEYQVIRDYDSEDLFIWEPWQIGNYNIRVNARLKGSTEEFEAYNDLYELTMNSKMNIE